MSENGRHGLRALILSLLLRSNIQAAVTDSKTVKTVNGMRQLVYPEGWPDITASLPVTGRAWGIEIKTEDGELRDSQEDRLRELEASGWLITLARSVEEVNQEIKRQFALLDRKALVEYLTRIRELRSEAAQRAAVRQMNARARQMISPVSHKNKG